MKIEAAPSLHTKGDVTGLSVVYDRASRSGFSVEIIELSF
jgi:hypothetical protein